jgi:hypothetical protein
MLRWGDRRRSPQTLDGKACERIEQHGNSGGDQSARPARVSGKNRAEARPCASE